MEEQNFTAPFLAVMGLIFMSAFFSGSETGLTSVTKAKIHKLKMEGNRRAATVLRLHEDKERLIGAILLGNNIVNIAASALATALAIRYLGEKGVVYATAVMTILVLVFAEVLPKTYAVRHAEKVALLVAPLFIGITKILSPFTLAVQAVVDRVLALITHDSEEDMSGMEVLRGAVEMYHEEGNVQKEDKDMLSGILHLEDVDVEAVMVHRSDMDAIDIKAPVNEFLDFVADSSHSRIPVWEGRPDQVIGILHTKDILKALNVLKGDIENLDVRGFLREPWFIPESITLKNQLKNFRERQEHIALVVDEFGSITGLITLEDILEEVVGEIDDEHDLPKNKRIRRLKDGSYNIDGDVGLRDLKRELDWDLDEQDATTLAGYILIEAQCIPEVGDNYDIGNLSFRILKKDGNQITRVKVFKKKRAAKAAPLTPESTPLVDDESTDLPKRGTEKEEECSGVLRSGEAGSEQEETEAKKTP